MGDNVSFDIIDDHAEDNETRINTMKVLSKEEEPMTFDERVRNYISKNPVKLYILTPCYGALCYVPYVHSLISTKELLQNFGIKIKIEFCSNDSLVSRARNNLVAKAMSDPEMTHMFFIDADITWTPVDVLKLIISDKSLVGGVYPLKHYFFDKLAKTNNVSQDVISGWLERKNNSQFKDVISDEDAIQFNLLKYNINYIDKELTITKNLAKVRHLATGFMMFKRKVIEQMGKAFPATKYTDDVGFLTEKENEFAYALFDCGVEDDHYFSEDWLFCHRWTKMGGSIWIDVTISLSHTGTECYKGCYLASIL
jgi:hypothetical protein